MTDWCDNSLTIVGNKEMLQEIIEKYIDQENGNRFKFSEIVEYPFDGGEITQENFNAGGYEWCCEHWGTKWEPEDIEFSFDEIIIIHFQTAWAPSIPIIKKLAELYPALTFKLIYDDPGMDYHGIVSCKNGEVIKEEECDWSVDSIY